LTPPASTPPLFPYTTLFRSSAGFLVLQPGLLGTLRSIFLAFSDDPSIQGRLDDYPVVAEYFANRPWFGRGIGTFLPELYILLDNQWLGTLITHGLVGVAALAGLHVTASALAIIAYRRSQTEADRHLCIALLSTQAIAVLCGFTFDTHAFDTFTLLVALLNGFDGSMVQRGGRGRLQHRCGGDTGGAL